MSRTRVLVVDDSALMRKIVSDIVLSDPELELVGTAGNGSLALQKIPQLNPDVITLDIEMPEMDGLTAVKLIHAKYPAIKVIMCSTLTARGAAVRRSVDSRPLWSLRHVVPNPAAGRTVYAPVVRCRHCGRPHRTR